MRRIKVFAMLALIAACTRMETPAADDAAATATLTEADIAGTWTGTAIPEGSDSAFAHWTQVCAGGTCRGTSQESPDTVVSTYTIAGDSSSGISTAYAERSMGGTMVVDRWVARVSGGQVSGTGRLVLAAQPDSVLMRYRFSGTRQ